MEIKITIDLFIIAMEGCELETKLIKLVHKFVGVLSLLLKVGSNLNVQKWIDFNYGFIIKFFLIYKRLLFHSFC